ncbi:MAG: hypothetical protein J0J15_14800 [Mesorhizobium sp.]|nr:hypothetical protein [Mesorhizobium sp.]
MLAAIEHLHGVFAGVECLDRPARCDSSNVTGIVHRLLAGGLAIADGETL